jgi:hypothetical protein
MATSMSEGRRGGLRTLFSVGMIVVVAGMGGAAAALYLKNAAHFEGKDALEPAPDRLDFGEVWEDTNFSMVLPITNHRGQDIEIKQFVKSCNCSQIEPPSLTIPAWETREIRLLLDLTAKKPAEFAAPVRDFEVSLSPEIPGEKRSIWWKIQGRVRSVMQSDLPQIDFGNVSESSQSLPVKRTTLTTRDLVQNLAASSSSSQFAVTVEKRSSGKSNQFDLVVALKDAKKRGALACSVTVIPELSDGSRLPPRQLEVRGRIVSDIEASPAGVLFNACRVGTSKTETVTLRSLTGQAFTVTDMKCEGNGLSVQRRGSASKGGGLAFEVTQKAESNGEHNGKVIFRISRSGGKDEEVVVPVSYFGFK